MQGTMQVGIHAARKEPYGPIGHTDMRASTMEAAWRKVPCEVSHDIRNGTVRWQVPVGERIDGTRESPGDTAATKGRTAATTPTSKGLPYRIELRIGNHPRTVRVGSPNATGD